MAAFGVSFLPSGEQQSGEDELGRGQDRLQRAVQLLNLRLPRINIGGVVPNELLQAAGGGTNSALNLQRQALLTMAGLPGAGAGPTSMVPPAVPPTMPPAAMPPAMGRTAAPRATRSVAPQGPQTPRFKPVNPGAGGTTAPTTRPGSALRQVRPGILEAASRSSRGYNETF